MSPQSLKEIEKLLDEKFRQFALDVKSIEDRCDDLYASIKDLNVEVGRLRQAIEKSKGD